MDKMRHESEEDTKDLTIAKSIWIKAIVNIDKIKYKSQKWKEARLKGMLTMLDMFDVVTMDYTLHACYG